MKIIAHRGFSGCAPENTMAAFTAAIDFGVDGLELDLHLSRDGELVICHDEGVDRTTNGHGLIKDLTWREIQTLDAGSWYHSKYTAEKIPRLAELLEVVRGTGLLINIELKTDIFAYPGIEEGVVRLVKDFDLAEQCIISSFNHYSLVKIYAISPEIRTGALYTEGLFEPWHYGKTVGVAALHPRYHSVTREMVAQSHNHGLTINTWTVDDPAAIRKVIFSEVDGIISNRPDVVKEVLRQ